MSFFCLDSGNRSFKHLLNKSPELDDVSPLLNGISASWYDIGRILKVSNNERDKLLAENRLSPEAKLEKILHMWICNETSDVTWGKIVNTLVESGNTNIAKNVTMYLVRQNVYDKYISKDDFVPSYF